MDKEVIAVIVGALALVGILFNLIFQVAERPTYEEVLDIIAKDDEVLNIRLEWLEHEIRDVERLIEKTHQEKISKMDARSPTSYS